VWINGNFAPDTANLPMAITYNAMYFVLTFAFTCFYTAITFETSEISDNLKRFSSFVVGVALDTMRQLQTQLVMRQYRGFIR
jgi:preprotein translocase subunit SecY